MRQSVFSRMSAAVIAAGLFVGCEKPADTPATTANPSTPAGADTVPTGMPTTVPSVTESAPIVTETPAAATAPAGADAASTSKATELLGQVTTYVKENKLDLADKALAQLDGMKGSLPASFQGQIENARKMVDAQKKGNQLKGIGGNLLGK